MSKEEMIESVKGMEVTEMLYDAKLLVSAAHVMASDLVTQLRVEHSIDAEDDNHATVMKFTELIVLAYKYSPSSVEYLE
jgi:hypothetical protein